MVSKLQHVEQAVHAGLSHGKYIPVQYRNDEPKFNKWLYTYKHISDLLCNSAAA